MEVVISVIVFFAILIFVCYYISKTREEKEEEEDERYLKREREIEKIGEGIKNKYKNLSPSEIIFSKGIDMEVEKVRIEKELEDYELSGRSLKYDLLEEIHSYTTDEIRELFNNAEKEIRRAKLAQAKKNISQKAQDLYNTIPADDERKPIPDDAKMYVWQRDKGRCVNCGSKENLEYDHIIPLSKGGSNTARNIQLLCEKCNRSKRDSIA